MLIGKWMTQDLKTVSPDDRLPHAADLMRRFGFNHLPVVEGEKLVGILSDTDLRNVSLAGGRGGIPAEADPASRRVCDAMKTDVWSVTPEDTLGDALLIITRKKFGALPVLSGDRLVGIITKSDLLRAFADILSLDEICLCLDVPFPRSLARFEELIGVLTVLGADVRSAVVTPEKGADRLVAHLRLGTIEGPRVKEALRARGFEILEPAESL
jgi:acetoin utilization protein AcuB